MIGPKTAAAAGDCQFRLGDHVPVLGMKVQRGVAAIMPGQRCRIDQVTQRIDLFSRHLGIAQAQKQARGEPRRLVVITLRFILIDWTQLLKICGTENGFRHMPAVALFETA